MKKIVKKVALLLTALMMVLQVSIAIQPVDVQAASPRTIYRTYINRYLYNSYAKRNAKYTFVDIDKDGTVEMFFQYTTGGRKAFKGYTLDGKKVKQILNITSNGTNLYTMGTDKSDNTFVRVVKHVGSTRVTVDYVKSNNKLLKYNTYEKRWNGYFRNGGRISEKSYEKNVTNKSDDCVNIFGGNTKVFKLKK